MLRKKSFAFALSGFLAGGITGLLGAGGGMVLVPLLSRLTDLKEESIFPASVSIILPICIASLALTDSQAQFPWNAALPYLIGSAVGGIFAGIWGRKLPAKLLHRILGILILLGGIRYLC